jgi:hypothetical protein
MVFNNVILKRQYAYLDLKMAASVFKLVDNIKHYPEEYHKPARQIHSPRTVIESIPAPHFYYIGSLIIIYL